MVGVLQNVCNNAINNSTEAHVIVSDCERSFGICHRAAHLHCLKKEKLLPVPFLYGDLEDPRPSAQSPFRLEEKRLQGDACLLDGTGAAGRPCDFHAAEEETATRPWSTSKRPSLVPPPATHEAMALSVDTTGHSQAPQTEVQWRDGTTDCACTLTLPVHKNDKENHSSLDFI